MSSCVSPAASCWRASRRWWAVRLGGLPKRTPLAFARVYTTKPSFRAPSGYATATLAPSKGRLMRCTVDGLTPSRSAMTRMPGRPGVARASRICFSSVGAIGGRPRRFPSLLARASPARTRSWIMARSNSANLGEVITLHISTSASSISGFTRMATLRMPGSKIVQQAQTLRRQLGGNYRRAGEIAAGVYRSSRLVPP